MNQLFDFISSQDFFQFAAGPGVDGTLRKRAEKFKAHVTKKFRWDFDADTDDCAPVVVELPEGVTLDGSCSGLEVDTGTISMEQDWVWSEAEGGSSEALTPHRGSHMTLTGGCTSSLFQLQWRCSLLNINGALWWSFRSCSSSMLRSFIAKVSSHLFSNRNLVFF